MKVKNQIKLFTTRVCFTEEEIKHNFKAEGKDIIVEMLKQIFHVMEFG